MKSETQEYRAILNAKFGEFSINSDKWSRQDLFTWLKLYKNGYFEKYKESLKKFFDLEKLPKKKREKNISLSPSKAVLTLLDCPQHLRIAVLHDCGVENIDDCEELIELLENAFKVRYCF